LKGVYEVAPNLRPFGTDFGNGDLDRKLFQFDRERPRYLASKGAALAEDPSKYVARCSLHPDLAAAASDLIVSKLLEDWPDFVELQGDSLYFNDVRLSCGLDLDSLCRFLQEDIALVSVEEGRDRISYVNVCNPSHWLPTEKVGLSFFEAHLPVPGFERVNAASGAMVDAMVNRGPFVRFVWGLESDDQLNHHPVAPTGCDQERWYGRRFDEGLFVRVERQVLWPLPAVSAALFTIRPIVYPACLVKENGHSWHQLLQAVESMSPAARQYKGLPETSEFLKRWAA
jgi:hypothetical protein